MGLCEEAREGGGQFYTEVKWLSELERLTCTVKRLFREHAWDQGKCSLKRGVR